MTRIISLNVDGTATKACLGVLETRGPHPGILVAHHQEGLSPFTHDLADKLAQAGYVAICPDHYHDCPPDADLATRRNALCNTKILRDLAVAIDFLRERADVKRDNLAVIGHCMGGRGFYGSGRLSGVQGGGGLLQQRHVHLARQ